MRGCYFWPLSSACEIDGSPILPFSLLSWCSLVPCHEICSCWLQSLYCLLGGFFNAPNNCSLINCQQVRNCSSTALYKAPARWIPLRISFVHRMSPASPHSRTGRKKQNRLIQLVFQQEIHTFAVAHDPRHNLKTAATLTGHHCLNLPKGVDAEDHVPAVVSYENITIESNKNQSHLGSGHCCCFSPIFDYVSFAFPIW